MEGSETSVQFHFDEKHADSDEPLLHFHRESVDDDDEPLLQLHQKEKDAQDAQNSDKPLVPEDGSGNGLAARSTLKKEAHVHYVLSSGPFIKVGLIVLVVIAVAALIIGFLSLALSAAGLHKKAQPVSTSTIHTPSQATNPPTFPTTTNPITQPPVLVANPSCGEGLWKRIAHLDMSDPSQQCPRAWRGYDSPVRCCGRPVSSRSSSPSVYYSTDGYQYTKVCGRATGYQQGSPDCFSNIYNNREPDTDTVDGIYVDGVSVTHGNPRTHIWTFAMGLHENSGNSNSDRNNCPCDGGTNPPPFVGNNYFCETGDDTPSVEVHRFFGDDPLWDGQDCHNNTCCALNSPPWFKVPLPNPTTDDIEVRICGDQSTGDEDSPISFLEIYVQ